MKIRLSKSQKVKILNSHDVYRVMQQVLLREHKIRRNQEHFWVVGLNNENRILFIELISLGTVNQVIVNPSDVFRMAIYKLAVKMILVHNHPSGDITPSQVDLEFTDRMIKAGRLVKIDVVDHLIISEHDFTSLADNGTIDLLQKSGSALASDVHVSNAKSHGFELVERAKALEIAKKMKEKGFDQKTIKELTGLRRQDMRVLVSSGTGRQGF